MGPVTERQNKIYSNNAVWPAQSKKEKTEGTTK